MSKPITFNELNKTTRQPARHLESNLQQACVRWFELQYPELRGLLFAVPNGGYRNAREGARFKREGVVAGVSDLILATPRGCHGIMCIEMKAGEGRLTKLQEAWSKLVVAHGQKYVVCRTIEEFINKVNNYLTLKN